ncbi:thiamine-phosphate kinase [Elioraea sp.]|uniref:thiamine-phosphate kinase n=1 Tax=Elioraea sp. TaxID=2185103 RepID=UPI003F72AE4B
MPLPGEFALIARHFRPLAEDVPGALALADDAALLDAPPGRTLVLAADAMVAGVHFLPDDPPDTIGRKLLRVNLSDLAAMGAEPLGYLMTTALPQDMTPEWLDEFARGLKEDQRAYGCGLLGGDTVSTPGPLTLSLTVVGTVAPGRALTRAGAREGDAVWVSGTIGDGALGLLALTDRLPGVAQAHRDALADRYRLPRPRLALGRRLFGVATSCLDVSDGLVQDLGHLCRAAGLSADIDADAVPLSEAARASAASDPALLARCLTGGDDYELVFTASETTVGTLERLSAETNVPLARIGRMTSAGETEVRALRDGAALALGETGWSHVR